MVIAHSILGTKEKEERAGEEYKKLLDSVKPGFYRTIRGRSLPILSSAKKEKEGRAGEEYKNSFFEDSIAFSLPFVPSAIRIKNDGLRKDSQKRIRNNAVALFNDRWKGRGRWVWECCCRLSLSLSIFATLL